MLIWGRLGDGFARLKRRPASEARFWLERGERHRATEPVIDVFDLLNDKHDAAYAGNLPSRAFRLYVSDVGQRLVMFSMRQYVCPE